MKKPEVVLLVEPDGASLKLRAVTLPFGAKMLIEHCHLSKDHVHERLWEHHGERDLKSQLRVFREVPTVAPPPPAEQPLYDELVVKGVPLLPLKTKS